MMEWFALKNDRRTKTVHKLFIGAYCTLYTRTINKPHKEGSPRCYHYTGCVSTNTKLQLLWWNDWEMGTATLCTKCIQVAGLTHTTGRSFSNVESVCAAVLTEM